MITALEAVGALVFYGLLLSSGAKAFGNRMGSVTRGAVIPLLFIPLICDWIRFAGNLPFKTSWALALLLYATVALASYLRLKPGQ